MKIDEMMSDARLVYGALRDHEGELGELTIAMACSGWRAEISTGGYHAVRVDSYDAPSAAAAALLATLRDQAAAKLLEHEEVVRKLRAATVARHVKEVA